MRVWEKMLLGSVLASLSVVATADTRSGGWYVISPTQSQREPPRRSAQRFVPPAVLDAARTDPCIAAVGTVQLQSVAVVARDGRTINLLSAQVSPSILSAMAGVTLDRPVLDGHASIILPRGMQQLGWQQDALPGTLTRVIQVKSVPGAPADAAQRVLETFPVVSADRLDMGRSPLLERVAVLQGRDDKRLTSPFSPPTLVVKLAKTTPQCTARIEAWAALLGRNPVGQAFQAQPMVEPKRR